MVIIVGAGAAGLTCAEELKKNKLSFTLIEARDRVGGRVFSSNSPVEFGAEFIHGAAPITIEKMREKNFGFYDVGEKHFYLKDGKLLEFNFEEKLAPLFSKLHKKSRGDMSIAEFVRSHPSLDETAKAMFVSFVEGFEAVDTHLMSRRDLAESESGDEKNLNGVENFRPIQRYDLILPSIKNIHFKTELQKISWSRGKVEVTCRQGGRTKKFRGSKLVLTLPIGVLKSDRISWNQKPRGLDLILDHLQMGHVQKIVFQFRSRFWEKLTSEPATFFHAGPENYFPTWWSMQPVRSNYLTAWQGGPKALEMSEWPEQKRIEIALASLAKFAHLSPARLKKEMVAAHTYNWSKDPFSMGAYSYVSVGGSSIVRTLKRPFENTIYVSGEATQTGSPRGTLEAGFQSGRETAALIVKSLSNS